MKSEKTLNKTKSQDHESGRFDALVTLRCPYCSGLAELKDSAIIYNGKSYGLVYVCENYPQCDSFVGVHKGTKRPKGTLANAELRELRKQCHKKFDPIWKSGKMKRPEAYKWLAQQMGLEEAHIGAFDVEQCKKFLASR